MFTGLINCTGVLAQRIPYNEDARFVITPHKAFPSMVKGESIAVNGACLSVEEFTTQSFTVYASQETLRCTTLGDLSSGSIVNLERALALGDRLGGHLVSGHVDGLAVVHSLTTRGKSLCIRLSFPDKFCNQIIPKGSVALDGISLTVNECGKDFLTVNIIPETQESTTIRDWTAGRTVNLETDMIGKYTEKLLYGAVRPQSDNPLEEPITEDFLRKHGF